MEARDAVLSAGQQAALDSKKVELAAADERYLRDHPEVRAMVNAFTKRCLQRKPDSVRAEAAAFFKDDETVRAAIAASK